MEGFGREVSTELWGDGECYIPEGHSFNMRISYDDQHLIWPDDEEDIWSRSEAVSQFPDLLIITGPVFNVCITSEYAEDQHGSTNQQEADRPVWRYASPSFLAMPTSSVSEAGYKGPPFSLEEVNGNTTLHLVALCFYSPLDQPDFCIHAMMLQPVDEDENGQIYERVTYARFKTEWFGSDFLLADIDLREIELRIR